VNVRPPRPPLVLALVAALVVWCGAAWSADAPGGQTMTLDLGKSDVVHLARPARDVLVASPTIADVVLRTADTAFVVGRKVGETNVHFFDAEGRQIEELDVTVTFDSSAVTAALRRALPNETVTVSTANQSIVLSGSVATPAELENVQQVVRQFVADEKAIVNLIKVHDDNQVLLRVRVTEMQRNTVKELGITPGFPAPLQFSLLSGATFVFGGTPQTLGTAPFGALSYGSGASPFAGASALPSKNFQALIQALEQNGMVKTLAEPNLTAVSGETASFLVGGKFFIPQVSGVGASAQISAVPFPFGIQLTFTPVVLSSGLISLRIATNVSEPTTGSTTVNGTVLPNLSERSATTTVELPSGGSIAMAGLLQDDLNNSISGLPGIMSVPILGALFSSKQFQHNETDLVIAVTAFQIKAADPNAIAFPSDGFGPASDFNMYFLGRLNATYTKPTPDQPRQPKGPFGFILE
jgi:pilus assembly protein CpaC